MISAARLPLFLLLLAVFISGCMGRMPDRNAEDTRILKEVPFFDDTGYQCGPSSLAAVINYWHKKSAAAPGITPAMISGEIYSRTARGVLGMDLESYARKNGFKTKQYRGNIEDLRKNILDGMPSIILVDRGMFFYQKNHFMVVTGHSGNEIILHSGSEEIVLSAEELERIWEKTGFWTLVITPSE